MTAPCEYCCRPAAQDYTKTLYERDPYRDTLVVFAHMCGPCQRHCDATNHNASYPTWHLVAARTTTP